MWQGIKEEHYRTTRWPSHRGIISEVGASVTDSPVRGSRGCSKQPYLSLSHLALPCSPQSDLLQPGDRTQVLTSARQMSDHRVIPAVLNAPDRVHVHVCEVWAKLGCLGEGVYGGAVSSILRGSRCFRLCVCRGPASDGLAVFKREPRSSKKREHNHLLRLSVSGPNTLCTWFPWAARFGSF